MAFNNNINNFGMNSFNMNMNNMNNPFMNPMNNSAIFMNNMNNQINPFLFNFQNNPQPNSQPNLQPQNFNDFRGNMNFINPMNCFNPMMNSMNNFNNFNDMNNFNNFNNQNNMPFQRFNSENIEQKLNINDLDTEIDINFRFVNSQIFKIKAKPKEKLIDVIERFKNNECPKELKNSLSVCLCHADKVDQNKTLNELNIKNGEQILFMSTNTPEENKENKNKEEKKRVLTDREKEFVLNLKLEYEAKYLLKKLNLNDNDGNNKSNNQEKIPDFGIYASRLDSQMGIMVKEHKHKLVYCLTNYSWKCNICNLKYKKEVGRYYCSLCDYNMCENCHYQKKYFMKKSFPKGTKPSNDSVNVQFLETPYHEHRLAFCRSSRLFVRYNPWYCDNCRAQNTNDKWSFYCTACDFDLCCSCCGFH